VQCNQLCIKNEWTYKTWILKLCILYHYFLSKIKIFEHTKINVLNNFWSKLRLLFFVYRMNYLLNYFMRNTIIRSCIHRRALVDNNYLKIIIFVSRNQGQINFRAFRAVLLMFKNNKKYTYRYYTHIIFPICDFRRNFNFPQVHHNYIVYGFPTRLRTERFVYQLQKHHNNNIL